MARPSIPDPEKRQNVGLRLHPGTLQRLDEIVAFFQELQRLNPLLPFGYPESRTDVVELLLREGIQEMVQHALAWSRLGTPREKPSDSVSLGQSRFWNTLITEVRGCSEALPESWRELEWPPQAAKPSKSPAASRPATTKAKSTRTPATRNKPSKP